MGGSGKIYHCQYDQHAKEVVSDNLGLVDFAIGLVNSVLNLPDETNLIETKTTVRLPHLIGRRPAKQGRVRMGLTVN